MSVVFLMLSLDKVKNKDITQKLDQYFSSALKTKPLTVTLLTFHQLFQILLFDRNRFVTVTGISFVTVG